jgi:hypothetical protein
MIGRAPLTPGAKRKLTTEEDRLPRPTLQFRLRAWRQFQRALDPLAQPRPLRPPDGLERKH